MTAIALIIMVYEDYGLLYSQFKFDDSGNKNKNTTTSNTKDVSIFS